MAPAEESLRRKGAMIDGAQTSKLHLGFQRVQARAAVGPFPSSTGTRRLRIFDSGLTVGHGFGTKYGSCNRLSTVGYRIQILSRKG